MKYRNSIHSLFGPLALLACLFFLLIFLNIDTGYSSYKIVVDKREVSDQPDFESFTSVSERKQAFFSYLLPIIQNANDVILAKRAHIEAISQRYSAVNLKKGDERFLDELAQEFKLDFEKLDLGQKIELLLNRVDTVPASLAIAQAAKESGWGTSRFAREANNYYGQWCFSKGCGVVPAQRGATSGHEVRKFADASASVESYLHNLNTHAAYRELRSIRASLRETGKISGLALAEGLGSYSERGYIYVEEIQSLIRYNDLSQFD